MANEFVARKGIISLGDLTIDTLSGNNGAIITLDAAGKLTAGSAGTGLISGSAQVDHDATTNFVANEHINHANVSITGGNGLTGGGNITADRTLAVGAGTGIVVNANDVAIDYAGTDNFILSATDGTSLGNIEGGDKIAFVDTDNSVKYAQVDQLPFTNNAGDITSVGAGAGLTGGGTSGGVTLTVASGNNGIVVNANDITLATSSTTFTGGVKSKMNTDAVVSGSATQVRTFLNVADGANAYSHPNHSGDVTSSGDGATTLAAAAITGKSALTTGLASTDEFLVSDAGTLKRMDVSVLEAYMQSELTFTTNTDVDVTVANLVARLAEISGNATIGGGSSTITIPGDLVVTGTTTTNNVETVSTSNGVVFEGDAADANELTLLAGALTTDQTVTLPDATGTVALTSDIGNGTIAIGSGAGLTGGDNFANNQSGNKTITLNVVGGTGIVANANDVALDYAGTDNFIDSATDLEGTAIATGDTIIYHDASDNNVKKGLVSDLPFTNNTGDITAVTAGTGLTGGGTSGGVTVNVIGGDGITANANDIEVDSTVIRTTGNQSMSGTKTFTGKVVLDTDSGDDVDMFTDYTATVTDATTTTIASYASTATVAVYFDYKITNSTTDLRAGTVMAISNGSTVAFTEYSTGDIGDTSAVTLSVDYSSSTIRLRATNNSGVNYRANVFIRTV